MGVGLKSGRQAAGVIGLLDVGTSKTVCLAVALPKARASAGRGGDGMRVLGIGHQPSRGLKAGVVVELDEAEHVVRAAVAQAERMAGVALQRLSVAVACGRLKSSTFAANTQIEGRVVGTGDIERLMAAGRTFAERDGRALLHMNCISYRLDGAGGIPDPRGLAGKALDADLHAVTADDAPLHNLLHVIERAHLSTVGLVPAPYASGLAATSAQERELGVACIDMGAGTTTLSVFAAGHLLANDVVPAGGNHVTFDIARSLMTTLAVAERIKRECGTLAEAADDDHALIAYQLAEQGGPAPAHVSRAQLRDIVSGRVAGLFAHLAERIERLGFARHVTERVVLTGGASQIPGLSELAGGILARQVRVAQIQPVPGMPAACRSPAFATVTGLIGVALDPSAGVRRDRADAEAAGYLGRVGRWFQESF